MRRLHIGALLALLLLVTACGAMVQAPERNMGSADAPAPMEENMEAEEMAEDTQGGRGTAAIPEQRMIVYNGQLDLVVKDTVKTQEEIGTLVDELGGFVLSSESVQREEGLLRVDMTVRVPAESFNTAMARLREMAVEVTRERVSSEDVTQEYVDLASRLRALETKAEKLEEFMDEAEDTEAVLKIYRELSATQEEIEHVKGRKRYLERSSSLGTITISLTPDALTQPIEVAGWRPQGTAKRALQALIDTYQSLVDVLIWIVVFVVPVLFGIGLVIFLFVKLIQWIFFRQKKKKETSEAEPSKQEAEEPSEPEPESGT